MAMAEMGGMKRNSGRSETLQPRLEREYLLKELIRCAHCGLTMWAQTFANGHRYCHELTRCIISYHVGRELAPLTNGPPSSRGRRRLDCHRPGVRHSKVPVGPMAS